MVSIVHNSKWLTEYRIYMFYDNSCINDTDVKLQSEVVEIMRYYPAGTSIKPLLHYAQEISSGKLLKHFDTKNQCYCYF